MKILKKNQIVIIVIAVMLITAGYLNYQSGDSKDLLATSNLMDSEEVAEIGDAKLVNSNSITEQNSQNASSEKEKNNSNEDTKFTSELVENENETDKNVKNNNESKNTKENNDAKETSAKAESGDSYFATSRLARDTMYSQMIETYEKILNSNNSLETQKQTATTEITKINQTKNSIMICENLIKTKGFENVVIFVNGESVSVIIGLPELKQEEVAQIQNIISRELNVNAENIHISSK